MIELTIISTAITVIVFVIYRSDRSKEKNKIPFDDRLKSEI